MLEEALENRKTDPSEASLALLSFFRDELPLGGYSANSRLVRLFPILLERVFGPAIPMVPFIESPSSNIGGSKLGQSVSSNQLETLKAAWLIRAQRWSYGPNNNVSGNGTRGSSSSLSSSSRSGAGAYTSSTSSGSNININADPVVQLLSNPRSSQQQQSQASPPLLLQVLEEADGTMSKVRLRFPTQALSKEMQLSLLQTLLETANTDNPGSLPHAASVPHCLWDMFTVLPSEQTDLRRAVHILQQQTQNKNQFNQSSPYSTAKLGGRVSPMIMGNTSPYASSSNLASPMATTSNTTTARRSPTFSSPNLGTRSNISSNTNTNSLAQSMMMHPTNVQNFVEMNAGLLLTLWEYYIMTFVNFPIVAGALYIQRKLDERDKGIGSSTRIHPYQRIPYGERVYEHLLRGYLHRYIPHDFYSTTSPAKSVLPSIYSKNSMRGMDYEDGDDIDEESDEIREEERNQKAKILLMLIKAMWLDAYHSYPTTMKSLEHLTRTTQRNRHGTSSADEDAGQDYTRMDSSFDLGTLLPLSTAADIQTYVAPSKQVQRSIRFLVEHLICDPALAFNCRRHHRNVQSDAEVNRWKRGIGEIASKMSSKHDTMSSSLRRSMVDWPLPLSQTMVQTSFYNYIRTTLRHAPVHTPNSPFYKAMSLWLIWLEPWNVVQQKQNAHVSTEAAKQFLNSVVSGPAQGSGARKNASISDSVKRREVSTQYVNSFKSPAVTIPSKYKSSYWESYVAANLHLYIVPLTIFIKRAREFDFSKRDFHKSMKYVQQVFRIYSPELVQSIRTLLRDTHSRSNENEPSSQWKMVLDRHMDILNEYCPPCKISNAPWSLEMLQQDVHNLLEEISLSHRNALGEQDFFEKLGSRIEGLFGDGPRRDAVMISNLLKQARIIVNFPKTYEVFPSKNNHHSSRGLDGVSTEDDARSVDDSAAPERGRLGFLTDRGREEILLGAKTCNAMDIAFLSGDPMYARVKSYEVALLVEWTVSFSDLLNTYFNLVAPKEINENSNIANKNMQIKLAEEREGINNLRFRFNLRFLADPRNWIVIVAVRYLIKLFVWLTRS